MYIASNTCYLTLNSGNVSSHCCLRGRAIRLQVESTPATHFEWLQRLLHFSRLGSCSRRQFFPDTTFLSCDLSVRSLFFILSPGRLLFLLFQYRSALTGFLCAHIIQSTPRSLASFFDCLYFSGLRRGNSTLLFSFLVASSSSLGRRSPLNIQLGIFTLLAFLCIS